MKFAFMLFILPLFVSCATTVTPKEKTVKKEIITFSGIKDKHESLKYSFSKIISYHEGALVYENKPEGLLNYTMIGTCKPHDYAEVDLSFLVESKVVGENIELTFRGKGIRYIVPTLHYALATKAYSEDITCPEAEVEKAYSALVQKLKEEISLQRNVASDKK